MRTLTKWRKSAARPKRLNDNDVAGRPFNQFKNYVWSQVGQIPLYEVLVREGFDAARATVARLVSKG